jgi:hypothetical protein
MKTEVKTNPAPSASPDDDRPGKVFKVEPPWRRCLVCDELFTVDGAREHTRVGCRPLRSL